MKRILAIARLTFAEGIRMRIVLVLIVILVFLVLRLPFALRGDDTLAGRLQNFLSYSLGAVWLFLSLSTVFLACATLSNEIKSRSLQLVVTKPVSRFQVLMGKWLGVNLLNVLMLTVCGLAIYGFAVFIRSQPVQFQRDEVNLRDVIWTARVAADPVRPDAELEQLARDYVNQRVQEDVIQPGQEDRAFQERLEIERKQWLQIPEGQNRVYRFENLTPPNDEGTVLQVRFRARGTPLPYEERLELGWLFIDPESNQALMPAPMVTSEMVAVTHQFLVRAAPLIRDRKAAVVVFNAEDTPHVTAFFEGNDGLQILYKVSSFEANYVKSLLMIFFCLAFLSAVGVFMGTFVSFPVACFCVLTIYVFCLAMPFWLEGIGANLVMRTDQYDPYGAFGPYIRPVLVPLLRYALPNFSSYNGVGKLVDGVYIGNGLLVQAGMHTLVYGAFLLAVPGWLIFRRREIAQATT